MDTFTYIAVLNQLSGRSVHDLSQYPVYPWVLADYASPKLDLEDPSSFRDLSKPVGALNAKRLATFRERFRHMAAPPPPEGSMHVRMRFTLPVAPPPPVGSRMHALRPVYYKHMTLPPKG